VFDLNRLYNADCMEAMQEIPDKYFQLTTTRVGRSKDVYASSQSLIESPCCPLSQTTQPFVPRFSMGTK